MGRAQLTLLWSLSSLAYFGCGDDEGIADTIDNNMDCRDICDRFGECYAPEGDYDVDNCAEECAENAKQDGFEMRVDACESCLDDEQSCTSETLNCANECTGVVLQSG